VHISDAGNDGVFVDSAGGDGVYVLSPTGNGFTVWGAGGKGVNVVAPSDDGVKVFTPSGDGMQVDYAGGNGVLIDHAGLNGVEIWGALYDGVQVNSAGRYGVQANTDATYGFYTPDGVYAGAGYSSAAALSFVAENGDSVQLEPGDLVGALGLAEPFAGGTQPVPLVGRSGGQDDAGLIGVVLSPFVAEEEVVEIEIEGGTERQTTYHARNAEGPIAPGEHLLIVVLGVAQVKVDPSVDIQAGQRLTASGLAGHARALRTETLNGMLVSEGAPVVGIALAAPAPGQPTIPVFVTLR
jgi:hypothetical protein